MIISRTPFRISFFGGGTDYPTWFQEHGGAFLSTTINRYCYVMCRHLPPFFDVRGRISWSRIEGVSEIEEIENPVVRESLRFLRMEPALDIHYHGDLPARAGLGSSSAFAVGLLNALHALRGEAVSKYDLAQEAIHVEQVLIRDTVGVQDQMASAHGGLNHGVIASNGTVTMTPINLAPERLFHLEQHMMLFFSGQTRFASNVAAEQVKSMAERQRELKRIQSLVDDALNVLCGSGDMAAFGELLHETWQMKRSLSAKVSTDVVDQAYDAARAAGAYGGKLLGAGGGGFLLIFAPPGRRAAIASALNHLLEVPIELEFQGSQIIFNDPGARSQSLQRLRAGLSLT
ncbi:MAG: kinase [Alphaproteobacteria bacterium]|nr:kinase [Alphaproteobacteria bacterium]TAD89376.1 MAG: kinase [Alphaproteobacteria bacterium]